MEKRVVIGVLGHTDHGKTTLVRMIGEGASGGSEAQKNSAITVDMAVTPYLSGESVRAAMIDVPGHHRYLKNAIRGLSHTHMAILVVAADDGIMPQTLEHIRLITSFNISKGLVAVSKTDLVDGELLEMAIQEVQDTLKDTPFQGKPIIPYSSVTGEGLAAIGKRIDKEALATRDHDHTGPFKLWIDRIRQFKGFGTVACGTIISGRVRLDQPLYVFPGGMKTKARTLEVHHEKVDHAVAGQRVGINLPNVSMKDVAHGMLLTDLSAPPSSSYINGEISLFGEIKNRQRVNVFIGASFVNAHFTVIQRVSSDKKDVLLVQLKLSEPIPCFIHSPILLLGLHDNELIGRGSILELSSFRYRAARKKEVVAYLSALLSSDLKAIVYAYFACHKTDVSTPEDVAAYTGHDLSELGPVMDRMVEAGELVAIEEGFLSRNEFEALLEKMTGLFKKIRKEAIHRTALNREIIYDRMKFSVSRPLFKAALARLIERKKVVERGKNTYELNNFQLGLTHRQQKIVTLLQEYAAESGMVPFSKYSVYHVLEGLCDKGDMKNIIKFLCNEGTLICLKDDIYIWADAVRDIKERVYSTISINGKLHLADSKKILGCGRTKGVFVFEYLDRIGFTCRVGDDRYLGEYRR